uniref:Uncharacterized protein n=1 Tax=Plectus sambesii TaxID=2011161 RepID=A0A914V5M5_9BILA
MNRLALLGFCLACLCAVSAAVEQVTVSLPGGRPFRLLRDDYASIGMDSILIRRNWCGIDWIRAIELGRQLQPAQLRFGGNDADRMWFGSAADGSPKASSPDQSCLPTPNTEKFYMSREKFDRLNWFASSVGWRLIFDLNVLIRSPDGRYNTSNAEMLLNYASQMNYSMDFELGNGTVEPE